MVSCMHAIKAFSVTVFMCVCIYVCDNKLFHGCVYVYVGPYLQNRSSFDPVVGYVDALFGEFAYQRT